jgi:putative transposase
MSKQSFHQKLDRQLLLLEEMEQLLILVTQIRQDHPRMSSRQMYRLIRPAYLGRDRFEAFCFENGFKVAVKRAFHRTTNSLGVTRFENLIMGLELTGINQVWTSDITYYRIGDTFYYLTFILDVYSRVIVGYSVSTNLSTHDTTIPALIMALRGRYITAGLIFHSDGGGQYYCKEWLQLTAQYEIKNSMCDTPYENPHAERINGIIKNDYLIGYGPMNYQELGRMTLKAVTKYNIEKPHGSLGNISPFQFEKYLSDKRGNVDDLKTSNPHSSHYNNNRNLKMYI